MILDSDKRPEIIYPCEWSYKIIGNNVDKMLEAVENAVSGLKYDITPSSISKKGNYYSLNLTLTVPNEAVRDLIYQKLDSSESVKIVF
jgi:putative lipoic acid-binding regulatory protein